MDETAFNWQVRPSRTGSNEMAHGTGGKVSKLRITLALCCNATGSQVTRPLIIHPPKKPRSFGTFDPAHYVDYFFNKKAWMTGKVCLSIMDFLTYAL